jgi:hypothetical protein
MMPSRKFPEPTSPLEMIRMISRILDLNTPQAEWPLICIYGWHWLLLHLA